MTEKIRNVENIKNEALDSDILILDQEILLSEDDGEDEAVPAESLTVNNGDVAEVRGPVYMVTVKGRESRPDRHSRISGVSSESASARGRPSAVLEQLLEQARELASSYSNLEARTRRALYDALGRAYDFSLAAANAPSEFAALVSSAGLTMQDRAPLVPVVKLVFGPEYDKTRLTEYATALGYGHRKNVGLGQFADFLENFDGGLKGVLNIERLLRKGEALEDAAERQVPSPAVARKLEEIPIVSLQEAKIESDEFALVMVRRLPDGRVGILGQVPHDIGLLERAARKLIAEKGRDLAAQDNPVEA